MAHLAASAVSHFALLAPTFTLHVVQIENADAKRWFGGDKIDA
jgi:hypothetical protein